MFLIVSGLAVFALPFSAFTQHSLLVHTLVGILFLPAAGVYLARHVRAWLAFPLTHIKFTGWASGVMLVVCVVSGLWLTGQGALGTRISYLWRAVHIVTTFGLILFAVPHLVAVFLRKPTRADGAASLAAVRRGWSRFTLGSALVPCLVVGALAFTIPAVSFDNAFPVDYEHSPYEGAGPFSPSLATTSTGGALDSRSLGDSASCGTSGCHEEIYREWLPSAHRYASMDAGFQKIQSVMAQQNGPVTTRYCGGCHDPISLFSGTKNIGVDDLTGLAGYNEGISCVACHAVEATDVQGNANYVMAQPARYVFELRDGPVAGFLSKFLIRTYPAHHVETLSRRMFKTPEFCAACHKQFIDEEVNDVGWVQLQNQYDNWRASRWHDADDPEQTIECRECHMPLVDSLDPAAGDEADFNRSADDGKHRSHRFLGANQFIPLLHELEGAEEHVELVEAWLRGELEIPEIADRWHEGPAVPIALEVPEEVRPGEEFPIRVHVANNKVGHDFPTGPLDIIQAWIEVRVTDADGQVVFHTGTVDERNFVEPGSYMFKAEPVDRYGNLIDRHNLWEMVGVRFKRSLFPGAAEVARFSFDCPGAAPAVTQGDGGAGGGAEDAPEPYRVLTPASARGPFEVSAMLHYRKFDQFLLNFAFGEDSGLTAPITTVAEASATVGLAAEGRKGL
ncbi:MAG: multiheme c-type cytochrome [Planctomycetota bacterium]|nr:multiheme c-type cytochrome [Planctomycetota bacterium]